MNEVFAYVCIYQFFNLFFVSSNFSVFRVEPSFALISGFLSKYVSFDSLRLKALILFFPQIQGYISSELVSASCCNKNDSLTLLKVVNSYFFILR